MKLNRLLIAAALLLCSMSASAQALLWNQSEVSWTGRNRPANVVARCALN